MRKIRLPVRIAALDSGGRGAGGAELRATCPKDADLLRRFFEKKDEWEKRNGREFAAQATLELPYQRRTFRQNSTVWKLVTAIFENMEGRLPDEEEKYGLYLDLLEAYADRTPNRISGGTRPAHISESNSAEGSRLIDGLLSHLAQECGLSLDAQATAQEVLQEWAAWRGSLEADPCDYADAKGEELLTEAQWREARHYSEASGRGGGVALHHIVPRGRNKAAEGMAWNWLALTSEEHEELHGSGDERFLERYPHLRGRFERAKRLAARLGRPRESAGEALAALAAAE
ncbi:MAG: hypothetical protein FWE09_00285 [Treponema sp.]|nr:hypothetical protein [Treponema sp.]